MPLSVVAHNDPGYADVGRVEHAREFLTRRGLVVVVVLLVAAVAVGLATRVDSYVGRSGPVTLQFTSGCANPEVVTFAGHTWQSSGPTGGQPTGEGSETGRFIVTAKRKAVFVSDADHSRRIAFVRLEPAFSQMPCNIE